MSVFNSIVFWTVHVVLALIFLAATQFFLSGFRKFSELSGIMQVVASACVATILFTPVALGLDAVFQAEGSVETANETWFIRVVSEFGNLAIPLVFIWLLINAPSLLRLETVRRKPTDSVSEPQDSIDAQEFWSRIPRRLGRDLKALSAELHYLRVVTTKGDALILFSFGRAVAALGGVKGMQIHRSHWVALDHVDEIRTHGGRIMCHLIDGPNLPVSRSYRAELKSAMRQKSKEPATL